MAYLFDTDAVSEFLRKRPLPSYVEWIRTVPRDEQFTSALVAGELYKGAYRSDRPDYYLKRIDEGILPAMTVLPYDVAVSQVYGRIRALLEKKGSVLADADLQIAATAIYHGLSLVTGNVRHFRRVPGLKLERVFERARGERSQHGRN